MAGDKLYRGSYAVVRRPHGWVGFGIDLKDGAVVEVLTADYLGGVALVEDTESRVGRHKVPLEHLEVL